jgi:type IV pilus assembly protein PilN
MIRINLLPYLAERKKENVRNQIFIFLFIIAIFTCGLGYFHFWLKDQIQELNTEITRTKQELEKYNKIVKQVEELEATLELLKQKRNVITELEATREESFRLMDTLTGLVVENRMWLTKFDAIEKVTRTRPKKKGEKPVVTVDVEIAIEGIALDNKTVADFMSRIENEKYEDNSNAFIGVSLKTLQQKKMKQSGGEDINLKSFTILCNRAKKQAVPEKTDKGKTNKK